MKIFSMYSGIFKGYLTMVNLFVSFMVYFLWFMVRPTTSEGLLITIILTIVNIYGWLSLWLLNDYNPKNDGIDYENEE